MFQYPVTLTLASQFDPKDKGYVVSFSDVPEANTQGDDRADALRMASEALELALSFYVEKGQPLPKPSARRGKPLVAPSLVGCMKLGIYEAMRAQKVRKTDLAKKLGWHRPQVDRLLDLSHESRIDQLEAAYKVLGKKVSLELETV